MTNVLVLGASGRIGSRLVRELDNDPGDLTVRLASNLEQDAERWKAEGRDGVAFDLNDPSSFAEALDGIDRVFLLTTYTAEMLFQSKAIVDAAADAGVTHIVHSGVFSSRRDQVPHYTWHDLIETYIAASGVAWTNLHPNNIIESTLLADPPVTETGSFTIQFGDAPQGWVAASDIAAVAAAVLREGPGKHAGKDYWLSTDLLTGEQVAGVLSEALAMDIICVNQGADGLADFATQVPDAGMRLYLQSAAQKMRLASSGELSFEFQERDDVQAVLGRPGIRVAQWAEENLKA